jgi:apolipoprotein N-acyltransferase
LWMLLEWVRGWAFSGFPWLALGYAFTDSPLAPWTPVLGVYGLTWIGALLAVAVEVGVRSSTPVRQRWVAGVVILVLSAVPLLLQRVRYTTAVGAALPVAVVQGAVPQDLKWQEGNEEATVLKYSQLTADKAWGARLIVWPEAALPILANDLGDYLQALQAAGRRHDADFAIAPRTRHRSLPQWSAGHERVGRRLVLQAPTGAVR